MKFAVKATTCLGCKTVLKPTNSVPSKTPLSRQKLHLMFCYDARWCCMQELQTQNRGVLPEADGIHLCAPGVIFATLDSMSTMPRVLTSGRPLHE